MKKLLIAIIIVLIVVAGCVITPEPTAQPTVVQPTETEPVIELTKVIPEELTPEPTTTEVQVLTPEPTIELTPEVCPAESFELPSPENLVIDTGEYGIFGISPIAIDEVRTITKITIGSKPEKEGEKDIKALLEHGGELSFLTPSPSIIYISNTSIKVEVNGQLWGEEMRIISSPSGDFIVPSGSNVAVKVEGGLQQDEDIINLYLLDESKLSREDISQPEVSHLSCTEEGWNMLIENTKQESSSVYIDTGGLFLLIKEFEGLSTITYPWAEVPAKDINVGFMIVDGDIINLEPGGKIEFLILSFLPYY